MLKDAIRTAILFLALAGAAPAQTPPRYVQALVIQNPSPDGDDDFGVALATAGGDVIVGAPGEDADGANAGIAYRFDGLTGELLATYRNPTPEPDDYFGSSIAAVGDRVLISAPFDDTVGFNAGAAYLFDRDGSLLLTIFAPPGPTRFWFGLPPVAASGTDLLVADGYPGSVHLFDGNTGSLLHTYVTPSGTQISSLLSEGDRVVAGASGPALGVVYVFDRSSGAVLHRLAAPTTELQAWFGGALALTSDRIVIGAHGDSGEAPFSGRVYVYDDSGVLVREIANPTPAEFDLFGGSIAAIPDGSGGSSILVSSPLDDTNGYAAGAVYLFDADSGHLVQEILGPNGFFNVFGNSLAALGSDFVVSAPAADVGRQNGGAVYVFGRDTDGDQLADRQEAVLGTDPADPDSDDDGLGDGAEVLSYGTNPRDADTDDDGLTDGLEARYGVTSNVNADTDLDGIIDGRDVELLQSVIAGMPAVAFRGDHEGLRRAALAFVDVAGHHIETGDIAQAIHELQTLRGHVDGCGVAPDGNDWVSDCVAQSDLRGLVDLLISNLD
jgi:hypothetical protein